MENREITNRILQLKKDKNAIILAHYYQNPEVQAIADYIGDSYQLSKIAKDNNASIIIFCGVHFMAETAKILSPNKKVIIPVKNAGCKMADSISYDDLLLFKKKNPEYIIIGYVNTSAKVKTLCDVCVTSSNAIKIINHYKGNKIMYVLDQNLAKYANYLNNDEHPIEFWDGCCHIHHKLTTGEVKLQKSMHPNAKVLLHPEARLDVLKLADYIGSTKGMLDYVATSDSKEFIVGTELGIIYSLEKNNPDKKFYKLSPNLVCGTMKMTHLIDVENALLEKGTKYEEINLDEKTIHLASKALNKMLELSE
ncbi:MAG: quinolinate synthase NadA [Bacilli bacterium]